MVRITWPGPADIACFRGLLSCLAACDVQARAPYDEAGSLCARRRVAVRNAAACETGRPGTPGDFRYHRKHEEPDQQTKLIGLSRLNRPATTYSPTPSLVQYHPRCEA